MADKITKITIDNPEYPFLLKQITDPPKQLYCRGNMELMSGFCFGVVGTRKLTSYGKEAAKSIVSGLVKSNFIIISGLAIGIDSVAHEATLKNNGKTIAVLGTGIDDIYPKININLAKRILGQDGLIISEYKKGSTPHEGSFPQRNRIISGLSKGVLIVEADEKSGSLITARLAGEQGRDVFAVPGSIFSSKSIGPHSLIMKGAKLVTSAHDILEEYNQLHLNISTPGSESSDKLKAAKPQSELLLPGTKDPLEKSILDILDRGFCLVDDIVRESKDETSKVLAALSMLEIKGLIKNTNGKYLKI